MKFSEWIKMLQRTLKSNYGRLGNRKLTVRNLRRLFALDLIEIPCFRS